MIKNLLSRLRSQKGFTLLELLIVISIIGILATLVVVNLGGARGSARDAQRISDLKTIQTALEAYFNDYGCYPANNSGGADCANSNNWVGPVESTSAEWSSLFETLVPRYLAQVPEDPINSQDFYYSYGNVGVVSNIGYDLIARLETNHEASCGRVENKYMWGMRKGDEQCTPDTANYYVISERLVR